MEQAIPLILSILTILAHALILLLITCWLSDKIAHTRAIEAIKKIINPYALVILFLIPLGAMLGSLIFSEAIKFEPCQLCWYQRMMMYPQAVLALIALIRRQNMIIPYLMALSGIGAIISAYHYFGQIMAQYSASNILEACTIGSASCSEIYILQFGYITIPLMTFTAFAVIIAVSLLAKQSER